MSETRDPDPTRPLGEQETEEIAQTEHEDLPTEDIPVETPGPPPEPVSPEAAEPAAVELPPLEEITFEPSRVAPPSSPDARALRGDQTELIAAAQAPKPGPARTATPLTLSPRRFRTLGAFADALIPEGGSIPYSASDTGVPERLDAALGRFDPGARRLVTRALAGLEWSTVFSRHVRPFSRLRPEARTAAVARMLASHRVGRRAIAELIKFLTANQWAATPRVEEALGFTYACTTAEPPREGPALEVLGPGAVTRDHVEDCDVVVIGSGAGGGVVAKELAEIGMSVVVLEEGGHYTRTDFTGPPFERFLKLYRRNGLTAALGRPPIPLPMGMAVGGSTLVNSGTCFRVPDRVLVRWEKEFGIPAIDPATMRPFLDRVERIMHVKRPDDALLGRNMEVFKRGVEKLGLHGEPIKRAIEGCRGCGVCAFGCPSDAKLGTHLTYLPRAQRHGATIYAGARAERILIEDGRARGVIARILDPRTREPRAAVTVRAPIVIVAAGAIHTPALLGANALGNRSGRLGRNLRIHPAAAVAAYFDEEVIGWRGTLQSYAVDEWHESSDLMIEVTSTIPSIGAGTFPGAGAPYKEAFARAANLASAGLFVSDTSTGRVIHRAGDEPSVWYRLNKHDTLRLVRGIVKTSEIFLAAGARSVITGIRGVAPVASRVALDDLPEEAVKPGALRLTAFHPVGTARMGTDPETSVVDPWGEVWGVQGLFVADASVLPGCPTVNPQVTIMAFATRTADHIARNGARYLP